MLTSTGRLRIEDMLEYHVKTEDVAAHSYKIHLCRLFRFAYWVASRKTNSTLQNRVIRLGVPLSPVSRTQTGTKRLGGGVKTALYDVLSCTKLFKKITKHWCVLTQWWTEVDHFWRNLGLMCVPTKAITTQVNPSQAVLRAQIIHLPYNGLLLSISLEGLLFSGVFEFSQGPWHVSPNGLNMFHPPNLYLVLNC